MYPALVRFVDLSCSVLAIIQVCAKPYRGFEPPGQRRENDQFGVNNGTATVFLKWPALSRGMRAGRNRGQDYSTCKI